MSSRPDLVALYCIEQSIQRKVFVGKGRTDSAAPFRVGITNDSRGCSAHWKSVFIEDIFSAFIFLKVHIIEYTERLALDDRRFVTDPLGIRSGKRHNFISVQRIVCVHFPVEPTDRKYVVCQLSLKSLILQVSSILPTVGIARRR